MTKLVPTLQGLMYQLKSMSVQYYNILNPGIKILTITRFYYTC